MTKIQTWRLDNSIQSIAKRSCRTDTPVGSKVARLARFVPSVLFDPANRSFSATAHVYVYRVFERICHMSKSKGWWDRLVITLY